MSGGEAEDATDALLPLTGSMEPLREILEGAPPPPRLRWLDIDTDGELMLSAREMAHRMVRDDHRLARGWASEVGRAMRVQWSRFYEEDGPACPIEGGSRSGRRRGRRRRKR